MIPEHNDHRGERMDIDLLSGTYLAKLSRSRDYMLINHFVLNYGFVPSTIEQPSLPAQMSRS